MCSFCLHCSILNLDIFIYMLVILCTCIYYFVCIRGVLGQAVEEAHSVSTPACCTLTGGSRVTALYSWAEALPILMKGANEYNQYLLHLYACYKCYYTYTTLFDTKRCYSYTIYTAAL